MNTHPPVSIIIPTLNQGLFLEHAIESLLKQKYAQLQILVYDGKSSDNSVDIIRKYEKHLHYWESEPDRGQSDAINKGFRRATGKYINWLCSDDILLPGALHEMVDFLERSPATDIVFGNALIINSKGQTIARREEIPFDWNITLYAFNYSLQPSMLFRRSLLANSGYLREDLHFCMDHEFWLRMSEAGCSFGYINKFLSGYRYHPKSKGTSASNRVIANERRNLRKEYGVQVSPKFLRPVIYTLLAFWFRLKRKLLQLKHHRHISLIPLIWRIHILERMGKL